MTDPSAGISTGEFAGLPVWRIQTPLATAAISPHGGQLLSWQPCGQAEAFFCSPISHHPPGAIRGGVPVCWPYFGRQGQAADAVQHGHARITPWTLVDAGEADDGAWLIDLALPADPRSPLRLRQRLRIGATLEQTLVTDNPGAEPVEMSQALHSYFAVADAAGASLSGLDGARYADKFNGGVHLQQGDWRLDDPRDPGRSDRIYEADPSRFVLADPAGGRRITVETGGSDSLVVWNPGQAGSTAIGDLPPQGWRGFVCVEAANARVGGVRLGPGEQHRLRQRVSISSL